MTWDLSEKGVRGPSRTKAKPNAPEPSGVTAMPGAYKLRMTFGDQKDSTMINVKMDPRFTNTEANMRARYNMLKELEKMEAPVAEATNRLIESKEVASDLEKRMKEANRDDLKDALEKTKAIKDSIDKVMDYILGADDKRQGITATEKPSLNSYIGTAQFYVNTSRDAISERDQRVYKHAEDKVKLILDKVNNFYNSQWSTYRIEMEKVSLSPFKDYEQLRKE